MTSTVVREEIGDHAVTLGAAFLRVVGLLDRPEGLLRPDRVLGVWWATRRHPAASAVSATPNAQARSR